VEGVVALELKNWWLGALRVMYSVSTDANQGVESQQFPKQPSHASPDEP
jgi:hypothetical protein